MTVCEAGYVDGQNIKIDYKMHTEKSNHTTIAGQFANDNKD